MSSSTEKTPSYFKSACGTRDEGEHLGCAAGAEVQLLGGRLVGGGGARQRPEAVVERVCVIEVEREVTLQACGLHALALEERRWRRLVLRVTPRHAHGGHALKGTRTARRHEHARP